jgi:hypothetical protein
VDVILYMFMTRDDGWRGCVRGQSGPRDGNTKLHSVGTSLLHPDIHLTGLCAKYINACRRMSKGLK